MKRIIFLTGCSGSGKTYLAEGLLSSNPELFYKLPQFTTRPKREMEDSDAYHFVSNKQFNDIQSILISKTEVSGNKYGTAPAFAEDKIALNVVNASGMLDGIMYSLSSSDNIEYLIINIENINLSVEREGRCIATEKLEICNALQLLRTKFNVSPAKMITLTQSKDNWIDVKDVEEIIERWLNNNAN